MSTNVRLDWKWLKVTNTLTYFSEEVITDKDKLQLTGRNLCQVFNFRNGRMQAMHFLCYWVNRPNLKLITRPKQLSSYLQLDITLPVTAVRSFIVLTPLGLFKWSVVWNSVKNNWSTFAEASDIKIYRRNYFHSLVSYCVCHCSYFHHSVATTKCGNALAYYTKDQLQM